MQSARTSIGEVAVDVWGRTFMFRPFFYRLENLGTPKEIFDVFNAAQVPDEDGFIAAWRVLSAFSDEENIDNLIGYFYYCEKLRKLRYVRGKMPIKDIHAIGAAMIRDAIIGRPTQFEKAKAGGERPATEFNPAEFVAIGDAHFQGIDWWKKTMIELQQAIRAKNGPSKEERAWMSADELDALYAATGKKEVLANGK